MTMLNALAAVQGGLQARETAFQGQASEQYRNALSQYGMEAPQTRQAFAAVDPRGANSLMMDERRMSQQDQQFQQSFGLQEREFEAQQSERQERLRLARAGAARAAADAAARLTAQQAAEQAARVERALAMATAAETPEDWDRIMTGFGEEGAQYVGMFDRRDEIFAGYMGLTDALKARGKTAEPSTNLGKLRADRDAGFITPEQYDAAVAKATQSDNGITVGPDGTVQIGGPAKPFTEGQAKDNVYVTKAQGALDVLNPIADALKNRVGRAAEMDPTGYAREWFQSSEFQVASTAMKEFVGAILRKDSGAAVTQQEMDIYGSLYGPEPGDKPEVLEYKRQARVRAVEAIKSGMSPLQILATETARQAVELASPAPAASPGRGGNRTPAAAGPNSSSPGDPMPSANLTPSDILAMPFEQLGNVDVMTVPPATFDALERRLMERK